MRQSTPVARLVRICLMVTTGAFAKEPTSLPRFELASIKLNTSNDTGSRNDFNGANVVFRNYVLGGILQNAFGVDRLNLEAPGWLYDERFDITAKMRMKRRASTSAARCSRHYSSIASASRSIMKPGRARGSR